MTLEKQPYKKESFRKEELAPRKTGEEAYALTNPETGDKEEYRSYFLPEEDGSQIKIEEVAVFYKNGREKSYTLKANGEINTFFNLEELAKIQNLWAEGAAATNKPIAVELYNVIAAKLQEQKEKEIRALD